MTVDFSEQFWGEKNNGFDVLYQNMKCGQVSSKELTEFFKERASLEETTSKLLAKLAKQAGNCSSNGTFAPVWQVVKSSSEKISSFHMQMVHRIQEIIKDVVRYCDEQHKKHKQIKDEESGTLEVVQAIQTTTVMLAKAKDLYNQRYYEYEKLKKENASLKDLEKAEIKFKKAGDDYKLLVEKYSTIREDFHKKMTLSCQHFQSVEEDHLTRMKLFLDNYVQVLENGHSLIGQARLEFRQLCRDMTVEKLLEQFAQSKGTGIEKPGPIEFEEVDLSSLSNLSSPDQIDRMSNGDKTTKREGFLKSRRKRRRMKEREASNQEDKDASSYHSGSGESSSSVVICSSIYSPDLSRDRREEKVDADTPTIEISNTEIDDEGYTIRPEIQPDKASFCSSSGSDTDEEKEKKIFIEIKPLSNGTSSLSASIDELRASVGGLTLSPTGMASSNRRTPTSELENSMKRSISVSQQIGKHSNDLLNLSFQSPALSSASTPTGAYVGGASSPSSTNTSVQSPVSTGQKSSDSTPTPTPTKELGDLFTELGDLPPALPPKQSQNSSSRGNAAAIPTIIPRPPSRRALESAPLRGRMSPISPLSRAESVSSISSEFRSGSMSVGSSRGPSPLTIGMSDTVPLAVAFQEIAHVYFKGTDESQCQVKLTGDMMVSFPAGIIQVLAHNPSPAVLSFRLKHTEKLENILPNKQLILSDSFKSSNGNQAYEFNMAALTALLRKQAEQNPSASYFNVDILKYQVKALPGAQSTPLQLVAYWKCDTQNTDFRVDYKYNSAAMTAPLPLLNVSVIAPVDGNVSAMQSKPSGIWVQETHRALWRFTELSQHSDNNGMGSIRARFELKDGPSSPGTIAAQFSCEGTTLSGADFELAGTGYRVSLVKRRFITGKYICETEPDMRYRYAPPP